LQVSDSDNVHHSDKDPEHEGSNQADLLTDIEAHSRNHGKWDCKYGKVGEDIDRSRANKEGDNIDACGCLLLLECARDGATLENVEESEDNATENDDESHSKGGIAKKGTSSRHAVIEHEDGELGGREGGVV
jgi:hypothetical protein